MLVCVVKKSIVENYSGLVTIRKHFARVHLDMLHKFACVNEHVH